MSWIKVSDATPAPGTDVLGWDSYYSHFHICIYYGEKDDDGDPLLVPTPADRDTWITYWMPLPEPPEEPIE